MPPGDQENIERLLQQIEANEAAERVEWAKNDNAAAERIAQAGALLREQKTKLQRTGDLPFQTIKKPLKP